MKMILLLFTVLVFFSLPSQGQKKAIDKNPIDSLFSKSKEMDNTDELLLALLYLKKDFDVEYYNYFSSIRPLFDKHKYSKSLNEFEKRRIIPLIKKDYENRQRSLNIPDYFIISYNTSLGSYSFEINSFPISEYYYPQNTIIYGSNMIYSIVNWAVWYHGFGISKDESVFPSFIPIDEKKAENMVKNNPLRKVTVKILVKNLREAADDYKTSSNIRIKTYAIATKIFDEKGLIATFPTKETIDNEIQKMVNTIKNIRTSCTDFKEYIRKVESVKDDAELCKVRIDNLLAAAKLFKYDVDLTVMNDVKNLFASTEDDYRKLVERFKTLPIFDSNEYTFQVNSLSDNKFNASFIPKKSNDGGFSISRKERFEVNGTLGYDCLSAFIKTTDDSYLFRTFTKGHFVHAKNYSYRMLDDIYSSPDENVKAENDPTTGLETKRSHNNLCGVKLDPNIWSEITKDVSNVRQFLHKDVYAVGLLQSVTAENEFNTETYFSYIQNKFSEQKQELTNTGYKEISGKRVISFTGVAKTSQNIEMLLVGYSYANEKGTVLIYALDRKDNFEKNKNVIYNFINGLVIY